jgi:hypothetical protein
MKRFLVLALLSFGAEARSFNYECHSFYWNGYEDSGTMELSVNARKATADIREESWDENLGGKFNPNYRSRSERPYVKFGDDLIVEKSLLSGGRRLKDGNWGGIARVEGEAEGGFFQYKFLCTLKK